MCQTAFALVPTCGERGCQPDFLGGWSVNRKLSRNGLRDYYLQQTTILNRGVGGRQYGASEDIETLQGKNNASTSRFRAVEECGTPLARRSELARIIRSCHRRIYRVVLLRTASFIQPNCCPSLPILSRTEKPRV